MNDSTIVLLTVAILTVGFIIAAKRFDHTIATIKSFLFSAKFEGKKMDRKKPENNTGKVEVSDITGKNIRVKRIIGAQGDGTTKGEAKVTNLNAEEDIKIDETIGLDQTP